MKWACGLNWEHMGASLGGPGEPGPPTPGGTSEAGLMRIVLPVTDGGEWAGLRTNA